MSEEKVALIVGSGGKGDGAFARALIEDGSAVEMLLHGGANPSYIPAQARATAIDLGDEKTFAAALLSVAGRCGKFDCLITCPDLRNDRPLWETTEREWEDCISINLTGVFMACKHAVPLMIERGKGRIINVISDAARMGAINGAAYAAAKAGVIAFSKALARETAGLGIRVNVLSLGMMEENIHPLGGETGLSGVPLKRAGKWEEAARMAVCLLDGRLDYMTGQTVHVNGGLYMP